MSYFAKLPKIYYNQYLNGNSLKLVPNILAKAQFIQEIFDNSSFYYEYAVKDGESPEDIAYKLYNDATLHWILLMANNVMDPQYGWTLDNSTFSKYINNKYGSQIISLNTTESYPVNYSVGETVFQGDSLAEATSYGTVISFNSTSKLLSVKFVNDIFQSNATITGASSGASHNVVGITMNSDGYEWASNTTSHYKVTELSYNDYDNIKTTNSYKVSANDYNHSTNQVITRNTNTSYNDSYDMGSGITYKVTTTVAPVTYYDYEVELNETKRMIKVPKKEMIPRIVEQFTRIMRT